MTRRQTRELKRRAAYAEATVFNMAIDFASRGDDLEEIEEALPVGWEQRWREALADLGIQEPAE